jgi:hypothetical protein
MPLSEWIARVPNALEVDDVSLWQALAPYSDPDGFALVGDELQDAICQTLKLLVDKGAVPAGVPDDPVSADIWLSISTSTMPLAKALKLYVETLGRELDERDLWLTLPKPSNTSLERSRNG